MPKLTRKPPAYTHHKPSGQARVRHEGKDYYLGDFGSRESREAYARLIATFSRDEPPVTSVPSGPTVGELILSFWNHAQVYYRRADGTATGEHLVIRSALKPLRKLYGSTPAADFGLKQLKLVRDEMVRMGRSRRYINDSVGRVKRLFNWAASEELVPGTVAYSLSTLKALEAGRSRAREKDPVAPVPDEAVEATLPHLPPVVADVVRLLRLSGARIGEFLRITPDAIDRSDPACWVYHPVQHKSTHKGKSRSIYLGPRSIEILTPYLVASGGGKLFRYTRDGVRQAIATACERHHVPHWHPHQLRHAAATEIRARFGLEAAQVVLGHSEADTTQVYANVDQARGRDAMRVVG